MRITQKTVDRVRSRTHRSGRSSDPQANGRGCGFKGADAASLRAIDIWVNFASVSTLQLVQRIKTRTGTNLVAGCRAAHIGRLVAIHARAPSGQSSLQSTARA